MPTKTLRIPIEADLDENGVSATLEDNLESIENFIMSETRLPDTNRGTYCEDSFRIEHIEIGETPEDYFLNFFYEWTAYYGCKDANTGGTEYDFIKFKYVGTELILTIDELPEDRDSVEEF